MAHIIASNGNNFESDFFFPNEGRVAEPSQENVRLALNGHLEISFQWLDRNEEAREDVYGSEGHPVTKSNIYLALFDRFHESNTNKEVEALRRIGCVRELRGKINSEVVEQLHNVFNRNKHFHNQMTPTNHIFLFKSIIDLHN